MIRETNTPPSPGASVPTDSPPNRIKEWRNRRRMSLAELGEIVGLSRSEISKLENGARRVRADHLTALATALRVKPEELIGSDAARAFSQPDATAAPAARTLPVLLARDDGGTLQLSDTPCDHTACPPQLASVSAAYAFLMPSTRMEPRVPIGALLYVHPFLPARPGDLAVVRLASGATYVAEVERGSGGGLVARIGGDRPAVPLGPGEVDAVERIAGLWFP